MTAVTRNDDRHATGHALGGGQIETLSTGRKNERIGHMVEKVDLALVEFFGNNLDRRGILGSAGQPLDRDVDHIGRVVECLDDEKYWVPARESEAISGDQFLDALARETGRNVQKREWE